MPNFCTQCGAKVDPKDAFCRSCGFKLNREPEEETIPAAFQSTGNKTLDFLNRKKQEELARSAAPKKASSNRTADFVSKKKAAPPKPVKKAGKRVPAVIVIIALIAGVLFTGFKYPGFFVKKNEPDYSMIWNSTYKPTVTPDNTGTAKEEEPAQEDSSMESVDWENIDYSEMAQANGMISTDPSDCHLAFTEEQIAAAPEQVCGIDRSHASADFGDVKVRIKGYQLENAEDELSLKTLGEISEGDEGWSIVGYDFSLASGQDTFETNVEITIPRTAAGDEAGTCVTYNEETQQWEELYSTISEDGKSYIIKTDHFSVKGEKKLKYIYTDGTMVKNTGGETVDLDSGIFFEYWKGEKKPPRMLANVLADRKLLWSMYELKSKDDIANLMTIINDLKSPDEIAVRKQFSKDTEAASAFIGVGSGVDNLNTLMSSVGYDLPFLGYFLTAADLALVMMKVQVEALDSDKSYFEALYDSVFKNEKAIGNSVFSAVMTLGAVAAYGNWAGALVGLLCWVGTNLIDTALEPSRWDVTDTPEWKDLYLVYYLTSGAKVNAGSEKAQAAIKDKKYSYAVMKKPKDLTDKQWEEVSKAINKKPLRVEEVYDEDAGEFRYDFINFDTAYTKLIEILYSDPYKMEKVIEQFQTSYAKAMWNLPDKNLYNFAKDQCELGAGKEYFKEEFTAAGDLLRPDKDDKKEMIEEMVSFVRARTAEQLEDAIDKALSNTFSQITFSINRVEHLLNTKLVFHVEDRNLLPGETFADSIYCVDWRSIKENEPYLPSNNKDHSGGYDDPELITPMRFVMEDSSPLFKPLQGVKGEDGKVVTQKIPYTEYYPYVPDFLPQAKKGQRDDVVYTCTLYHYLMMGAPKKMLFKNCGNPKEYVDQEGVLADIEFPEITEETVVADVKIKVSTGNDIGELEGMWGPARNGTKYENKDRGQVAFIVENGGKSNTFTSSLSTQEECYFMEDGRPENSRFIYKREPKKDGEVQKGTLTIWKPNSYPEEKLVFTVEEVEKDVIFLKEWNFYLERFSMPKGTYSLKCKTDHFLSSSIEIPNASLSIRENDTLILEIPAVSASYSDSDTYTDGETRNSTHELTRDKITIKAKLTNMADIPYGYDDAVGKTFTVTDITPTVTATNKVKDVFTKKNGSQETNLKQYTYKLEKFSIAKGEEEYPFSSNVIVYFDCKKKDQVRFIQMNLVCEKTETSKNERESDKAKTYGPSEFTYYSQWDNR